MNKYYIKLKVIRNMMWIEKRKYFLGTPKFYTIFTNKSVCDSEEELKKIAYDNYEYVYVIINKNNISQIYPLKDNGNNVLKIIFTNKEYEYCLDNKSNRKTLGFS